MIPHFVGKKKNPDQLQSHVYDLNVFIDIYVLAYDFVFGARELRYIVNLISMEHFCCGPKLSWRYEWLTTNKLMVPHLQS